LLSTPQAPSVFPPTQELTHVVPSQEALALGCKQLMQLVPHRTVLESPTQVLSHLLMPSVHWQIEATHELLATLHAVPVGQQACW